MSISEMVLAAVGSILSLIWLRREGRRRNSTGLALGLAATAAFILLIYTTRQNRLAVEKFNTTAIALQTLERLQGGQSDVVRKAFESYVADAPMEKTQRQHNLAISQLVQKLSSVDETDATRQRAQQPPPAGAGDTTAED